MAHDQWAQFYLRYQVYSSSITVHFTPVYGQLATTDLLSAGTGPSPAIIGIKLSPTAGDIAFSNTSDLPTGLENRWIKWKCVTSEAGQAAVRHTLKFKTGPLHTFLGRSRRDDTLGALFGANPVVGAFFMPFVQPLQTSTTAALWVIVVKIKYNCILSKPDTLTSS